MKTHLQIGLLLSKTPEALVHCLHFLRLKIYSYKEEHSLETPELTG
jgi:hypothetical protein